MAKKKKKKNTKLRLFFTIIFALIVVVLVSLIAAQRLGNMTISAIASETKAYFMSFGAGDGFPYEIDSSDVKNIVVNNSNLFMLLENESKVITPTAKEIYNSEHRYTD
ncbi:MAG: hypothetical protein KBT46_00875, partial [Ruminococcus sp.]|nr:hypothetical protein [Candidatus Copronaster equi]